MSESEDPVKVEMVENGDQVVSNWLQPGRRTLLSNVAEVRDNRLAKEMEWGRAELEIPVMDLHFLKKANPDLDSKDATIKTAAWKKFLASPESLPYRTRGRGRFLNRSFGGIANGGTS
jgi:hypothetical protein